jgi:hypothetical protein
MSLADDKFGDEQNVLPLLSRISDPESERHNKKRRLSLFLVMSRKNTIRSVIRGQLKQSKLHVASHSPSSSMPKLRIAGVLPFEI